MAFSLVDLLDLKVDSYTSQGPDLQVQWPQQVHRVATRLLV